MLESCSKDRLESQEGHVPLRTVKGDYNIRPAAKNLKECKKARGACRKKKE